MIIRDLSLIGLSQIIVFVTVLLLKKQKRTKDYMLVIFLLLIGCEFFYRYLQTGFPGVSGNWAILFDIVYWALFGPVLYFYTRMVIDGNFRLKVQHLAHLFILVAGMFAVIHFVGSPAGSGSFVKYFSESTG
nr:hypothetical protein [Bacteroidota bacterium]